MAHDGFYGLNNHGFDVCCWFLMVQWLFDNDTPWRASYERRATSGWQWCRSSRLVVFVWSFDRLDSSPAAWPSSEINFENSSDVTSSTNICANFIWAKSASGRRPQLPKSKSYEPRVAMNNNIPTVLSHLVSFLFANIRYLFSWLQAQRDQQLAGGITAKIFRWSLSMKRLVYRKNAMKQP